ncbi:MAG: zinc metallopeptidase [Chloroflexi bacterium]|nr:zinc metallopeptidase [Chloroflexota bacterium]
MIFDPMYWLFAAPALLLVIYAQFKVRSTYGKYSKVRSYRGTTGAEVARMLLRSNNLTHVDVEMTKGELTDHYDPTKKVLRLSEGVYASPSVAAVGIVAHEVGHAVQDAVGYAPLKIRAALVPAANIGSSIAPWIFLIGLIAASFKIVVAAIVLFSAAVLFTLVTLPVEFNASRRALAMLKSGGLVSIEENAGARAVLSAAALTYVAALMQALGSLLYFIFAAMGMRNRD